MQPRTYLVLAEVFFPFSLLGLPFSYISLILTTISLKIAALLTQKQKFRLRALTKYHSNSAYPPKFLVQFEAKYLPQIAPEAVSEHEYVKNFLGGHAPRPP